MFADDFDPMARLAREDCPRCKVRGLVLATDEDCDNLKSEDRALEWSTVCPSVAAKCLACGLVGEWPAMSQEPQSLKPKRVVDKARG